MPLEIIRNDITRMDVDVIVNAANPTLLGGGGVDGAIHRAAGPKLLEHCRTLGGCHTGQAKITPGYRLKASHIIHTVGPVWLNGARGERELLRSCYQRSLELAAQYGAHSIAFPLISAGSYGFPAEEAMKIAVSSIRSFLEKSDMLVYLVVYDHKSYQLGAMLYHDVAQYIDDHYVDEHFFSRRRQQMQSIAYAPDEPIVDACAMPPEECAFMPAPLSDSLEEALRTLDESFSEMVLRMIDEKGMTDVECYKRANMDRKLFSKIRSDRHYKPSKRTAVALGVALKLDLDQMQDLLRKAGFALSHSAKFDVIVEYFLLRNCYDIDEINQTLFQFDQLTLGG